MLHWFNENTSWVTVDLHEHALEAAARLKSDLGDVPSTVVITGSGQGGVLDEHKRCAFHGSPPP